MVGVEIYVLRDDLTGFGLGGNKTRKLDFLVGDALARGADSLITSEASSLTRNAAAAATMHGLDLHVLVAGTKAEHNPLSRAWFAEFGTMLHYTGEADESIDTTYEAVREELQSQGRVVYDLHPGGSTAVGALSYVEAYDQIVGASKQFGVHFRRIVFSSGSAGTQAGLAVGQSLAPYDTRIVGVCASVDAETQASRVRDLASSTALLLGTRSDDVSITVDDNYIGPGYAIPSEAGERAQELFARSEGLLLDSVYTAKAAAALLDYATDDGAGEGGATLFIHTGGNSGLFY